MFSTLYYDYFRCNLKQYVGVDFPITAVIFYLTVGLILATFFIYVQNRAILYALKRLYKHKCFDKESAQTIEELHLKKHKFILYMLRGQSMLSHYVRRVLPISEQDDASKTQLRKVDFQTDKFYLDEKYFTRSKGIIDRGEEPLSRPLLSSLAFFVVFLVLFFTMPSILSLLF
jgi:hypothetical protein